MKEKIFLYRDNEGDRDSVKYLDLNGVKSGHIRLCGANFSTNFSYEDSCFNFDERFGEIETILTREEFFRLIDYVDKRDNISDIINKLLSEENEELFAEIVEDEKLYLMDEYYLSRRDIDYIFSEYGGEYQDRGIIKMVHDDYTELAEEYINELVDMNGNDFLKKYIDYDRLGQDIVNDGDYLELFNSDKIVEYAY